MNYVCMGRGVYINTCLMALSSIFLKYLLGYLFKNISRYKYVVALSFL
jgi:hypothetical protein